MERNCKNCKNQDCYWVGMDDDDICDEFLPKTNADRIRTMTDEELAEWIAYRQGCFERQDKRCSKYGTCRDCWLDWLKEECDGE